MKFKNGVKIITYDFWYDLLDGGYIKPKNLLEKIDDILEVERAKMVLIEFKQKALANDAIKEYKKS